MSVWYVVYDCLSDSRFAWGVLLVYVLLAVVAVPALVLWYPGGWFAAVGADFLLGFP